MPSMRADPMADRRSVKPAWPHPRATRLGSPYESAGLAVAGIWLAVAACSVFAPDMVTGSEHEHFPIAAMTCLFSGSVASGLVLTAVSRRGADAPAVWSALAIAVLGIWAAVTAASVFAPSMVTGTDPTTIPIAALAAPLAGSIATAFACVFAASSARV